MKKNMIKRICSFALVLALCLGAATSALAAGTGTIVANSLNVRAGAGTKYKILQELSRNAQVYYLGVSDLDDAGSVWHKVQYGAWDTGWVSARYCSLNEDGFIVNYVEASDGSTNIRLNPNLEGSYLGVLPQGSTATYLGQVYTDDRGVDWYFVNYRNTFGWVSSMYTTLHVQNSGMLNLLPNLFPYGSTGATVKVEGGDAFLRSAASLNGRDLDVIREGYSAVYLNERGVDERGVVWFKVNYNGVVGWVSSRYAMLYGNQPVSSGTSSANRYVQAVGGSCNVRNSPSLNGKSINIMEQGESAVYLNERSTDDRGVIWYKVRFEGSTGWVSSKYAGLDGKVSHENTQTGSYVRSTAKSNLRRQPGLDSDVIDTMQKNEIASFTGFTTTDERGVVWYKVVFEGVTGWVSSKYTVVE